MSSQAPVKLIVGLGNPGERCRETRHNVGYSVVEALSEVVDTGSWRQTTGGWLADGRRNRRRVVLLKPGTYMNRSGGPTARMLRDYGCELEQTLVVHDDVDLPPGRLRFRAGGGAGGHRGVLSVIEHVGDSFHRLKLGIGRSDTQPVDEYVLEPFEEAEVETMARARARAVEACLCWLEEGIGAAMNEYNPSGPGPAAE